MYRN
jgi:dynein heavy chain